MRVAALYDIHANLPALEAVLDDLRRAKVDHIVVGGDVVLGPMPRETLARLMSVSVPVQFICGNCDREVLACASGVGFPAVPEQYRASMRWVLEQLPQEFRQQIAGWPGTRRLAIDGLGDVLFCHATPRNDVDIFTRETSEDRLLPLFDGADAPVVVCGHTHMQFDRRIGKTRVVNAGSVGMPFGEPGAHWALLGPDVNPGNVELRRTTYDLHAAAQRIESTEYPQARDFASRYVLQPPSEMEMLAAFSRADLK